jgi:hypothetical protein
MNDQEITDRIMHFQNIDTKYGIQAISATTVYKTFEEIARPIDFDMVVIRPGLFGHVVNHDLVHLMKLQPLKGASYSIWWGVSLSYVPHGWRNGLHWHRSLKSSRFDLFEIPNTVATDWREVEKNITHSLNGEVYLRETMQTMWNNLSAVILDWLSSVNSINDVQIKALEQVENKRKGLRHSPDPLMVLAFTYARINRLNEAISALESYLQYARETVDAQDNLKKAIYKTDASL